MLTQLQRQRAQTQTSHPVSVPAPVGGWNTRDALDKMDPTDAVALDNWFPDSSGCTVRGGSSSFATGLGSGNVETLAEYYSAAKRILLAACNGAVYNISSGGVISSSLAFGFSSNRWQTENFQGTIFLQNGVDAPQSYDGTTFGAAGWSGTGLTATNLMGCLGFKGRLYFWESSSQNMWFSAVAAVTGTLTKFSLADIAQRGGVIMLITRMSHDAGDGLNDYLMIVMTTGEVIMYSGVDPTNATNFVLVGSYMIGAPVNVRSICRYGADAYLTILDDHTSLSTIISALDQGLPPPKSKITGAVQAEFASGGTLFGWQAILYPKGHAIIFNIPHTDGTFVQHVFSTAVQAWARWVGLNASCWSLYKDNLYYGGAGGIVYQADTGNSDTGSVAIQASGQQAWTQLGPALWNNFNQAYRKRIAAVRPIVQATGSINYSFGIGFDYQSVNVIEAVSSPTTGSLWNVSPWNTTMWSSDSQVDTRWRIAGGSGQSISFGFNVAALQTITWLRTDLRVESGMGSL